MSLLSSLYSHSLWVPLYVRNNSLQIYVAEKKNEIDEFDLSSKQKKRRYFLHFYSDKGWSLGNTSLQDSTFSNIDRKLQSCLPSLMLIDFPCIQHGPSLRHILDNDITSRNQIIQISTTLQQSFDMGASHLGNIRYWSFSFRYYSTWELLIQVLFDMGASHLGNKRHGSYSYLGNIRHGSYLFR